MSGSAQERGGGRAEAVAVLLNPRKISGDRSTSILGGGGISRDNVKYPGTYYWAKNINLRV